MISFFVPGIPIPQGSMRAFPFQRAQGGMGVSVTSDNPKLRQWRDAVRTAGLAAGCKPVTGAVVLEMIFSMPRPAGHMDARNGELRKSAPVYHVVKPDVDKLIRAVMDALSPIRYRRVIVSPGVAYNDDSQVIYVSAEKKYAVSPTGVFVRVS